MQALRRADRHELMVSRVKLDMIDPVATRIEAFELRRMLISEAPELKRGGAPSESAKRTEVFVGRRGTLSPHSLLKSRVRREQVHVLKRRALIEGLLVWERSLAHCLSLPRPH
jgi:hypothetical protein